MADQATATVLDVAAVLDSALEAFVTVDGDGRVTGWNPAAERTFGYRCDEALGRRIDELVIRIGMRTGGAWRRSPPAGRAGCSGSGWSCPPVTVTAGRCSSS